MVADSENPKFSDSVTTTTPPAVDTPPADVPVEEKPAKDRSVLYYAIAAFIVVAVVVSIFGDGGQLANELFQSPNADGQ